MGILDAFVRSDIDRGVEEWKGMPGAVLLDVRNPDEYARGHIEGSVNLPLGEIEDVAQLIPDVDTRVFVYCRSGARSGSAVRAMNKLGYKKAKNIGGIMNFHGETVQE